jgi:hypothetical protein
MQTPDVSELLSAASKVLPPEAVQAIQSLPEDQQLEALQRLLQQSEIDFGPLSAKHAKYLNVQTCGQPACLAHPPAAATHSGTLSTVEEEHRVWLPGGHP